MDFAIRPAGGPCDPTPLPYPRHVPHTLHWGRSLAYALWLCCALLLSSCPQPDSHRPHSTDHTAHSTSFFLAVLGLNLLCARYAALYTPCVHAQRGGERCGLEDSRLDVEIGQCDATWLARMLAAPGLLLRARAVARCVVVGSCLAAFSATPPTAVTPAPAAARPFGGGEQGPFGHSAKKE